MRTEEGWLVGVGGNEGHYPKSHQQEDLLEFAQKVCGVVVGVNVCGLWRQPAFVRKCGCFNHWKCRLAVVDFRFRRFVHHPPLSPPARSPTSRPSITNNKQQEVWHPSGTHLLSGSTPLAPACVKQGLGSTWRHYEEVDLPCF